MNDRITHLRDEYDFLSNFFSAQIEMDGKQYPSVEHAYQAAKTLNDEEREVIRTAPTAGKARRLGKQITPRGDWNDVRLAIMYNLLWQKFEKEPFRSWLTNTGNAAIIEGNCWHDKFWGMDDSTWTGENHLGKLLMSIRGVLNEWR